MTLNLLSPSRRLTRRGEEGVKEEQAAITYASRDRSEV